MLFSFRLLVLIFHFTCFVILFHFSNSKVIRAFILIRCLVSLSKVKRPNSSSKWWKKKITRGIALLCKTRKKRVTRANTRISVYFSYYVT